MRCESPMPLGTPEDELELNAQALARLRLGRDRIAEGRWCQRAFVEADRAGNETGSRCAAGWVGWDEPAWQVPVPVYARAIWALWLALPPGARRTKIPAGGRPRRRDLTGVTYDIGRYNDHRTRRAVLTLFDRAIAVMEDIPEGLFAHFSVQGILQPEGEMPMPSGSMQGGSGHQKNCVNNNTDKRNETADIFIRIQ
jgi:hypothetical protein